jgi:hypothetical protein
MIASLGSNSFYDLFQAKKVAPPPKITRAQIQEKQEQVPMQGILTEGDGSVPLTPMY